ncbi:hypothetical protein [Micromonospora aurantiaca (nom. illeg.)]|uniref:hypothetical protein n=1 Tax=Micromonospora aurantiaca (nom. illeg.) TaxID=47850 RepID=UPI003EBD7D16
MAAEWYEVGNFWTALTGVSATLLVGGLTLWMTYRVAVPKRRVVYRIEAEELVVSSEENSSDVTIHHKGRQVRSPHSILLGVGNDGRRDVPSSAFDESKPIVFDFAAPVVEISHRVTKPRGMALSEMLAHAAPPVGAAEPKIEVSGSTLRIGPSLMASRQIIVLALLVEGQPRLSVSSPLIDVQVINNREVLKRQRRFARVLRVATLIVAAIAISIPVALTPQLGFALPLVVFSAFLVATALAADRVTGWIVGKAMNPVDISL